MSERDEPSILIFVYGTLKENFHWHSKFLRYSDKVGNATTKDVLPLVLGDSGVPYLLGDLPGVGRHLKGEVWKIGQETLDGLDEYEGLRKGHYDRRQLCAVLDDCGSEVTADVYFKVSSSEGLRQCELLEEYSLELHQEKYRPIRHIEVKQQLYVGGIISGSNETQ